jgi:hypothetical protein
LYAGFFLLLLNLLFQLYEWHHTRKKRFLFLYLDFRTMVENSLRDRSAHIGDELVRPYRVALHAFREKVTVGDVLHNARAACLIPTFVAGNDRRAPVVHRHAHSAFGHSANKETT